MNTSKFINPEHCVFCGGKCCTEFTLQFSRPDEYGEVERFRLLDSGGKIRVEELTNCYIVHFNYPCTKFKDRRCTIYDKNRPRLCKEYPFKEDVQCPYKQEVNI